jgi:hypothetical protein
MKKTLLILFIGISLLASSCTKNTYVVPNQTILTTISGSSWTSSDGGKTFSTSISVPEIDNYFNDHGGVLIYISFGGGVYEQIPEVYDGIAFSYTHTPGAIEMDIQSSDGISPITPPGNMSVKIVLVESK